MTSKNSSTTLRAKIQGFGGFLTNMVLPNIGAFIAWGLVTALFIPKGWLPNESLATLVDPSIKYLLPLLLAFTGGKMVAGHRGGVLGAIGTMGLIIGSDIPMFLGAMIVGPLGGWLMKKIDKYLENKIPAGFEMIVNNFSIGIIGFILMIVSFLFVGPTIELLNGLITQLIEWLVSTGLLPLLAIINEPAKILFLNNVIDQGVYYPLGMQQTLEQGKSIYFMVASNPGAGLGLLLAYSVFGQKIAKRTAPGAAVIHFIGGIHELYFPYVLMKPLTIVPMILGSLSGIITFKLFDVGLVAGPSPGSIISYLILTPKGSYIGVILGVLVATIVTFIFTSIILKYDKRDMDNSMFEENVEKSKSMKEEGKYQKNNEENKSTSQYKKIAFACDAGMGSSAMGATTFRKKLEKNNINGITVKHYRIEDVPKDNDIIVVHKDLANRAKKAHPHMRIVQINNFLNDRAINDLLEEIKNS